MKQLFTLASKTGLIATFFLGSFIQSHGQDHGSLMELDTLIARKLLSTFKKYEYIGISGYIQPQFQWTQTKGAKNYNGGDFSPTINNRFMLRRGRFRAAMPFPLPWPP